MRSFITPLACLASFAALSACLSLASCSWGRFDDDIHDPPVELLDRPGFIQGGYGSVMASAHTPQGASLFAGGQPLISPGALFSLGDGSSIGGSNATAACLDTRSCRLLGSAAEVADVAQVGSGGGCFVYGVGAGSADLGPNLGLLGSCTNGKAFKLSVPPSFGKDLLPQVFALSGVYGFVYVASVASADGQLLVASPDVRLAWLYAGSAEPSAQIAAPASSDRTFGVSVAMIGQASGQAGQAGQQPGQGASAGVVAAVAAPGSGQIYLYDVAKGQASLRGCVSRGSPYGVVMHGFVDKGQRLLAVSDGLSLVDVLDVDAIKPGSGDPAGCEPVPAEALRHSFRCSVTDTANGCNGAAFGYSLASGDLDGDGDQELVVGAPGFNISKTINGGAVQLFDLEGPDQPKQTLYLSSADKDDRLGSQVVTLRFGQRDVVAANAFSKQKIAVFHCSVFDASSPRCQ